MKTDKNLTIIPPKGMEAYQEGNEIKFRSIKNQPTYKDVVKKLFENKDVWRLECESINKFSKTPNWYYCNNCASEKQAKKLLAVNQLMNVAKYLNGDWQPNWNDREESKYYIKIDVGSRIQIGCAHATYSDIVYFRSIKLAQQAIEILGEETIRIALSTDW